MMSESDPEYCQEDEFRCRNGRCIYAEYRCNDINDCDDEDEELWLTNSDEFNCHSSNMQSKPGSKNVHPAVIITISVIFVIILLVTTAYLLWRRRAGRQSVPKPDEQPHSTQPREQQPLVNPSSAQSPPPSCQGDALLWQQGLPEPVSTPSQPYSTVQPQSYSTATFPAENPPFLDTGRDVMNYQQPSNMAAYHPGHGGMLRGMGADEGMSSAGSGAMWTDEERKGFDPSIPPPSYWEVVAATKQ